MNRSAELRRKWFKPKPPARKSTGPVVEKIRKDLLEADEPKIPTEEKSDKVYETGIAKLDDILGGGFPAGTVNEFIGFTASGKTYLSQTILLQMIENDQINGLLLTKSSKSNISTSLRSILKEQGHDDELISFLLNRIKVQTYSSASQLNKLITFLQKRKYTLLSSHKILLLDGLSSEFLRHYMERDFKFNLEILDTVERLQRITRDYNLVVFITNLTMSRNEVRNKSFADSNYSLLTPKEVAPFIDTRLLLTKRESPDETIHFQVQVKLIKSQSKSTDKDNICVLSVTEEGLFE